MKESLPAFALTIHSSRYKTANDYTVSTLFQHWIISLTAVTSVLIMLLQTTQV